MHQDIPVRLTAMPTAVIAALRCPICAGPLSAGQADLSCPTGHHFDIAKHGYAHLGAGRKLPEGDSVAMVAARERLLASGQFAPLAQAIAGAAGGAVDGTTTGKVGAAVQGTGAGAATGGRDGIVADLGAGIGYYLAAALDAMPGGYGLALDVSKPALRRAARAHPRAAAVLADTWGQLPIADAAVDVLLNVFAPRNGAEMRRVLRPGGSLIVATPTTDHLLSLRRSLDLLDVDPDKDERLARSLPDFTQYGEQIVDWHMSLSRADAFDLVAMGPSARHTTTDQLRDRLAEHVEPLPVTASVRLTRWR